MLIVMSVLGFILGISVLVAVHEYGHMWVAKRCGVKVLRFSIGFGPVLWSKTSKKDGTEYVISAVPLGGYVAMLDEEHESAKVEDQDKTLNAKSTLQKTAVLLAGPAANFVLAFVLFYVAFVIGIPGWKPIVGDVDHESMAYQVGFRSGDEVKKINSQEVVIWNDVLIDMLDLAIGKSQAEISVMKQDGTSKTLLMDFSGFEKFDEPKQVMDAVGIKLYFPKRETIVGKVVPNTPASKAGIAAGDRIVSIDGMPVSYFSELTSIVSKMPGQPAELELIRNGETQRLKLVVGSVDHNGAKMGQLGVTSLALPKELVDSLQTKKRYGLVGAASKAIEESTDMVVLTLKVIGKIFVGEASLKNISGPLTIAQGAGMTLRRGASHFLSFMAYVSLMLGLVNLFPIPVLDGGRVVYYWAEAIKGSPISAQGQHWWQSVGIAMIVMLMFLAFYNDITRIAG